MPPSQALMWRRVMDDRSVELARVAQNTAGTEISGLVLIAEQDEPLRVDYRILCDPRWITRSVDIQQDYQGQIRRMALRHDGAGHWQRDGEDQPALDGCLDVDLGVTPSTNALPINRLALAPGEVANITATWIRFPTLDIVMARQSYERVAATRYRYIAVASGFTAEIEVDDGGLPIDYAGIWRRIASGFGGDSCLFPWSSAPATAPPS